MKTKKDNILFAVFVIVYSVSCFTISTDKLYGTKHYFAYGSTINLLIKFLLVFCFTLAVTIINKNNLNKAVDYVSVFLNITLALYAFDYYNTHFSGVPQLCRFLWLSAIYITQAAFYTGLSVSKPKNFNALSEKFWKFFIPIYLFTFLLVFARSPNVYYALNLKIGNGLIGDIKYLFNDNNNKSFFLFSIIGNIAFFIPIPFMLKAVFKKIRIPLIVIFTLAVPFIVEGYQYIFKCGSVDIDDILFNLMGGIIGITLCRIERKIHLKS